MISYTSSSTGLSSALQEQDRIRFLLQGSELVRTYSNAPTATHQRSDQIARRVIDDSSSAGIFPVKVDSNWEQELPFEQTMSDEFEQRLERFEEMDRRFREIERKLDRVKKKFRENPILLRWHIIEHEARATEFALMDYRIWNRQGTIEYKIRPMKLEGLHTRTLGIREGQIVRMENNDEVTVPLLNFANSFEAME